MGDELLAQSCWHGRGVAKIAARVDDDGATLRGAGQRDAQGLVDDSGAIRQQDDAPEAAAAAQGGGLAHHERALLVEGVLAQRHAKNRRVEQDGKDSSTGDGEDKASAQSARPPAAPSARRGHHAGRSVNM